MEVATLVTRLVADVAAFETKMAAATKTLEAVQRQLKALERTTADLEFVLGQLGVDHIKLTESIADIKAFAEAGDKATKSLSAASVAAKSIEVKNTTQNVSDLEAQARAADELADNLNKAARAGRFRVFTNPITGGTSIQGPSGRFVSAAEASRAGFSQLALPPATQLGRQNFLTELQRARTLMGNAPQVFDIKNASLIPSGRQADLRWVEMMSTFHAMQAARQAEADMGFFSRMVRNAGDRMAGSGILSALGMGGGGGIGRTLGFGGRGGGGWGWGWGGRLLGGLMRPLAGFGTVAGLAGFGAERVLTSGAGLLGSAGGGLLGGGLLGAGALGTAAVGMGTDLAGIGQAAGDTKLITTDLNNLNSAIQKYGRNSQEAAAAQQQLNMDLGSFSKVAQSAVLAASQTAIGFKTMFDKVTGQAEKTGAQIINQAMRVGEAFLPTIGKFAAKNMLIIQKQLQPFFAWLRNPGGQGGLGIFTDLERIFQRNLPAAMHALTQGFEVFVKIIDIAAQHTGGLTRTLDAFFTKWNQPSNFPKLQNGVNSMIGLFKTWIGLFGALGRTLYDLFKPSVGFGQDFVQQLTNTLKLFNNFLGSSSMQKTLGTLFEVHKEQINAIFAVLQSLLPSLDQAIKAFLKLETLFASIVTGPLKQLAKLIGEINKIPFANTIIGWSFALLAARKAVQSLIGLLGTTRLGVLGIGSAAKTSAVAFDEAQAAEQMALRKTGGEVATVKASIMSMVGRAIPWLIALSLVPGNKGGEEILQAAGLGGLGNAPLVGGFAQQIARGANALRGLFGEKSLLPPSDKATFQQQYPIVGALMNKTGVNLATMAAGFNSDPGKIYAGLVARGMPAALARHFTSYITQKSTAQDLETYLYQHPAFNSYLGLTPAQREAATTMQTTGTASQRAAARAGFGSVRAAIRAIDPSRVVGRLADQALQRALVLPPSIKEMERQAQAGLGNQATADAAARAYYLKLLHLPGLPRSARTQIEDQLAFYPKPLPTTGAGGTGFGGPTSAGGAVFRAQQALSGAVATGSPAAFRHQIQLAKNLESAASSAYAKLSAQKVPLTQMHAKQVELTKLLRIEQTARNDIVRLTERQAKAQAKLVDDSRRTQISQHQTAIEAIRSNLVSGVSGAATPQAALSAVHKALLTASGQYAQLWMMNKKLLGQTNQTSQLKAEENRLRKEMNSTLGIIHTAEKDQAKALKAQDAAKLEKRWERLFGITKGDTASTESVTRRERSTLLGLVHDISRTASRHLKGVAAATGKYSAIPGAPNMSIPELIKSLQAHGVHFTKRALEDFAMINKYLAEVKKHGAKVSSVISDKITALLTQIEQNTNPRNQALPTYHLASLKTVMDNLTAIKDPHKRKAAAEKLLEMEIYGGMLPKVHSVAGVPIFHSGHNVPPSHVTINIHGYEKDPKFLAEEIRNHLLKTRRRNSPQTRGINGGRSVGLG